MINNDNTILITLHLTVCLEDTYLVFGNIFSFLKLKVIMTSIKKSCLQWWVTYDIEWVTGWFILLCISTESCQPNSFWRLIKFLTWLNNLRSVRHCFLNYCLSQGFTCYIVSCKLTSVRVDERIHVIPSGSILSLIVFYFTYLRINFVSHQLAFYKYLHPDQLLIH